MKSMEVQFPNVKVIGEEGQALDDNINPDWIVRSLSPQVIQQAEDLPAELRDAKDEDITVWVDPLDGTAEYTQGLLDHVTVLIGNCSCFIFM